MRVTNNLTLAALLTLGLLTGCSKSEDSPEHGATATPAVTASPHGEHEEKHASHGETKHHEEPASHGESAHHDEPASHGESAHHEEPASHGESSHHEEPASHGESAHHEEPASHGESTHQPDNHDAHGDADAAQPKDSHGEAKGEGGHGESSDSGGHGGGGNEWNKAAEAVTNHINKGDLASAEEEAVKALDLARKSQNRQQEVTSLHNLGKIRMSQGEIDEAIHLFEEAVEHGEKLEHPNPRETALCLNKLAAAHYAQRKPAKAKTALHHALKIVGPEGDLRLELLQNLAAVSQQQGDMRTAEALLEEVRVMRVEAGDPPPCEGASLLWASRVWPAKFYKSPAVLYDTRQRPVYRGSASARYLARVYPKPPSEEQEAEASGGH